MPSPADLALPLIVLAALATETVVGFGSTVITVTFGAMLVPIEAVLAAYIPVNMALSAWIVVRDRAAVDRGLLLRRMLPLVGLGTLVGMALFRPEWTKPLLLTFGVTVVGLSALQLRGLLRPDAELAPLPRKGANALLTVAGVMHGLFGVAGPLVVFVLSREVDDKRRFRATLAPLWFVLNAALVVNYARLHLLGASSALRSASFVPALLAGAWLGQKIHARVPERPFKLAVSTVLLLAGVAVVVNNALRG
ncbi:MAG: sulfite exporter TauE/SafE family protein [Polyangiales bacterium]